MKHRPPSQNLTNQKPTWPEPSISLVPASEDSPPINPGAPDDQAIDSPPLQDDSTIAPPKVKVTASSLRVRKSPTKEAPVLFHLPKDAVVDVVDEEDETFFQIKASGDRSGYVMKIFTAPVE